MHVLGSINKKTLTEWASVNLFCLSNSECVSPRTSPVEVVSMMVMEVKEVRCNHACDDNRIDQIVNERLLAIPFCRQ